MWFIYVYFSYMALISGIASARLPKLYEYYTAGGITAGLSADQPYFTLNKRNITIYSGAVHYFRVPRQYWRDRLRKLRAAGLNTVETYVAWNLHEPISGYFDFGNGGSEFEDFLDVKRFFEIAKEEDLLAIVRPGPYICGEWEFGGFPSWLLRNKGIKFRTSEPTYMKYVTRYFNKLLPILKELQFTKGGPIVAFQVENEYASTNGHDMKYLEALRNLMLDNGIVELLTSADGPGTQAGTLPGKLLQTVDSGSDPANNFGGLRKFQPGKPLMAMEFYDGWFDHWSEKHHTTNNMNNYEKNLKYNASLNIYMFHGGTSFGFMNGANLKSNGLDNSDFQPDTTSYDYDAALSENGNYTRKYHRIKKLLKKYNPIKLQIPALPRMIKSVKYKPILVDRQIPLGDIIKVAPHTFEYENVVSMEVLPMNNASGQSFGYIVYRKENTDVPSGAKLTIAGHVCDTVVVLVNGKLISKPLTKSKDLNGFGYWKVKNSTIILTNQGLTNATIDLVVENWGRVNYGLIEQFASQFKGIWQGSVYLNGKQITHWKIIPLEFKKSWTNSLTVWQRFGNSNLGPKLYEATLEVDVPHDTFIDMQEWIKGIVIVNGFVLGRYARIGPQQCLYLPAPFLKRGKNKIVIFEHFIPATKIKFSDKQIFKTQ